MANTRVGVAHVTINDRTATRVLSRSGERGDPRPGAGCHLDGTELACHPVAQPGGTSVSQWEVIDRIIPLRRRVA